MIISVLGAAALYILLHFMTARAVEQHDGSAYVRDDHHHW